LKNRLDARLVYLALTGATSFSFSVAFTTSAIYRFKLAELDPLQMVLLGTALEASVFLFEVPTGVVADLYSRRASVIIGYVLIGLGLMLEGALPYFPAMLFAQVIWGLGHTFTSGALDAWLADEASESALARIYLRASQLAQVTGFVGIFVSAALASMRLNLPLLSGGFGFLIVSIFLIVTMPETRVTGKVGPEGNPWAGMAGIFKEGMGVVRSRPLLVTIMGITLLSGLYSEAVDRLWEVHILDNFALPALGDLNQIYWFGLINGSTTLLIVPLMEIARRHIRDSDHKRAVRLLFVQNALLILSLAVFGLSTNFLLTLAAFHALSASRSVGGPIFSAWINRGIDPKVRATVLSAISQMDAIGQVVGGPLLGSIASRLGLRTAMVSATLLLTPVLALYARAAGQGRHDGAGPKRQMEDGQWDKGGS
jgi:DHA3 family tetracycline resistance protein-like MFS transporter